MGSTSTLTLERGFDMVEFRFVVGVATWSPDEYTPPAGWYRSGR